jgi:hypothetical protein
VQSRDRWDKRHFDSSEAHYYIFYDRLMAGPGVQVGGEDN